MKKCQNDYVQQSIDIDYERNKNGPERSLKKFQSRNVLKITSTRTSGLAMSKGLLLILWILGFQFTEASAGTRSEAQ